MTPEQLAEIIIQKLREESEEAFIEPSGYGTEMVIDGSFNMERVAAQVLKAIGDAEL